jgi:hypothetical protein
MENVKGFDESTAHDSFIDMLKSLNYTIKVSHLLICRIIGESNFWF